MRHQIIDVRCDHCNARASRPCRSVGDRVIIEPHQRRIQKALGKGWGADVDENLRRTAIQAYEKATLMFVFGRFSSNLLSAALKHRSIDPRRKWVRDAFAGNVNLGSSPHPEFHPKVLAARRARRGARDPARAVAAHGLHRRRRSRGRGAGAGARLDPEGGVMAGRIDAKDLPAELLEKLGIGKPAARRRRSMTMDEVRTAAIRVLHVVADLTAAERRRVLRQAGKLNDV